MNSPQQSSVFFQSPRKKAAKQMTNAAQQMQRQLGRGGQRVKRERGDGVETAQRASQRRPRDAGGAGAQLCAQVQADEVDAEIDENRMSA